jgi:hypothetical protein
LTGRVLVVVDRDDENAILSFRNLPDVQILDVAELNAYDVLCNEWIVFTSGTLPGRSEDEAPSATEPTEPTERTEPTEPTEPTPTVLEASDDEAVEPAEPSESEDEE